MNTTIPQNLAQQTDKARKPTRRNKKVCIVCGAPAAGMTGYIYYASDHAVVGVPFCEQHLSSLAEYASPVFENKDALNVFQEKHPRLYLERVKGRQILFLKDNKPKTSRVP